VKLTAKGAATRQRIIAGTADAIRESGIASLTLDDVCARTHTSKGQLFHYFPDGREQLLLAVARYEADQVLTDQEPHILDLTTWTSWSSWRDTVIERYRRQGVHCPLGILMTELGRDTPATHAVRLQLLERWESRVRAGIAAMQERGHIDRAIDAGTAAAAVIAGIQGGVTVLLSTASVTHLEAAFEIVFGFLGAPEVAART
jgi:AcrR family transcriptional regulator